MASQRIRSEPNVTTTTMGNDKNKSKSSNRITRRDKRMNMAKRGLRSLAIAVALPVSLTILCAYLGLRHNNVGGNLTKTPFWFPPMWALHLTCPASSFLMGVSAWLVWAEGGFHRRPMALCLYLAQLVLMLMWEPIVFGAGARWVGLLVCLGMFGALVGCSRVFKQVNPFAGDLMKPCLAWTAFLAVVNLKLVFL
ncbi:Translocator protein-like [Quillaja saponaria]|uniref:Translocator protein-like n=1 Tax=Quillaja saponaria TaxID=32244 RepID=A0AAD7Q161_QUISA|nr:Translocator protein-like [Quillaja saponaria]